MGLNPSTLICCLYTHMVSHNAHKKSSGLIIQQSMGLYYLNSTVPKYYAVCAYTNFSYTRIHTCTYLSTRMKSAEEKLVIFIPNCTGKALDSRMVIAKLWRKSTHSTTTLTLLRKQMHYVYKIVSIHTHANRM